MPCRSLLRQNTIKNFSPKVPFRKVGRLCGAGYFSVKLFFEETIRQNEIENESPKYFKMSMDGEMSMVSITVNPNLEAISRENSITVISDKGNIYSFVLRVVKIPSLLCIKVKKEDAVFKFKNTN